jgi:hypothetical protein
MRRQSIARLGDRPLIRVQIPLGGGQRAVPGELPQDVYRDAGISHPGQSGVPQVMPHQVWVPRTSFTSCDQVIFVDQVTDASLSCYAVLLKVDWFG